MVMVKSRGFDCWLAGVEPSAALLRDVSAGSLELPCSYDSGWWGDKAVHNVVDEKRI